MSPILVIDDTDNVATTLAALPAGTPIALSAREPLTLREPIEFGHKFALTAIPAGGAVRKYGVVVAYATRAIAAGEHVHVHNVESNRGRGDRA